MAAIAVVAKALVAVAVAAVAVVAVAAVAVAVVVVAAIVAKILGVTDHQIGPIVEILHLSSVLTITIIFWTKWLGMVTVIVLLLVLLIKEEVAIEDNQIIVVMADLSGLFSAMGYSLWHKND